MERDQELIDRIRRELNLSKLEFSDDEIWEKTKDMYIAQRIGFGISVEVFKKGVCDLVSGFKVEHDLDILHRLLGEL